MIVVFIVVKYIFTNKITLKDKMSKVISVVASLTFGMYLIDPLLKTLFYEEYLKAVESIPVIVEAIGWVLLSMLIGGLITWGLKKIPGVKKLI